MLYKEIEALFDSKTDREIYVPVEEDEFTGTISGLGDKDIVLIGLFAAEDFQGHRGITLLYVLEARGRAPLVILLRRLNNNHAASVAWMFPTAVWYEREITDGFGVQFSGSFDTRPLFLHEVYPHDFHPLRKSFRNRPVETRKDVPAEDEYRFKEVGGEGVYQIPVGPVHAGIIEPGHFRFSVIGETIFNLEIRMFFKHRGIEKLAEGKDPLTCVKVAETISGDESAVNAFSYSRAVEKICGTEISPRSWSLRTVLLESERIYSHLGDMAGMVTDVAFPKGASRFFVFREEILRWNDRMSGSRFLKGIICPGGLSRDIDQESLKYYKAYLESFLARFKSLLYLIYSTTSVIDRLETTGRIRNDLVDLLNITGPAARASGAAIDTRRDHPYGVYGNLEFEKRTAETCDVMGRFNIKAQEIMDSVNIIQSILNNVPPGEIYTAPVVKDGCALMVAESPRGQTLHWVNIKNGGVDRYKIRTASFCNWQAIEHAVLGNIVPDFPLINKSLNLSYAGTDL